MPTTVPHRELRNHSAELLRRAAAGESFEVTNNGRVVALLVPPPASPLEAHLRRRLMTPATATRLPRFPRVYSSTTTAEVLTELRGDR
jgi:prevent-host-death family protein